MKKKKKEREKTHNKYLDQFQSRKIRNTLWHTVSSVAIDKLRLVRAETTTKIPIQWGQYKIYIYTYSLIHSLTHKKRTRPNQFIVFKITSS